LKAKLIFGSAKTAEPRSPFPSAVAIISPFHAPARPFSQRSAILNLKFFNHQPEIINPQSSIRNDQTAPSG
jgi:hypothetical protein